jgi:ankyrin repeat protein
MGIGNNQLEAAHVLIEAGADVNSSDWYGRTPLWQAVEVRNMDFDNGTIQNDQLGIEEDRFGDSTGVLSI